MIWGLFWETIFKRWRPYARALIRRSSKLEESKIRTLSFQKYENYWFATMWHTIFLKYGYFEFSSKVGKYASKMWSYSTLKFSPEWSIWVRMGIPASLESASGFSTKPSYYNLKMPILNFSPNIYICSQNESLRKCPQKSRKIFKIGVFKL